MFTKYDTRIEGDKKIQVSIFDNLQFEYISDEPRSDLEKDFKMFVKIKINKVLSYQLYQEIGQWLDDKPALVIELNKINIYHKDLIKKEKYIENGKEKLRNVKIKDENLYFGKKKMNALTYMQYIYEKFDDAYKNAYNFSVWDYNVSLDDKYKVMYENFLNRKENKTSMSYLTKSITVKNEYTYNGMKFIYEYSTRNRELEEDINMFVDMYQTKIKIDPKTNQEVIDKHMFSIILKFLSKNWEIKHKFLKMYGKDKSEMKDVKKLIENIGLKATYESLDDVYKEVKGVSVFDYMVT